MDKKTLSEILAMIVDAIDTGNTHDLSHLSRTLESDHYKERFNYLAFKREMRGLPPISFEAFMERERAKTNS